MGESALKPAALPVLACLLGLAVLAPQTAWAGPLGKPAGLQAVNGAVPRFLWSPVPGAGLYRIAVMDEPDRNGKRATLAAVWVSGTAWTYAVDPVLPRAAGLPSTRPQPLAVGHRLHVMVRAADGGGAAPGPWASIDFTFAPLEPSAPSPRAKEASSPTATPTPTPGAAEADAELELQGGSEDFKVSPEAQAIDIASASAGVSPPAAAAAAQAPTPTPVTAEGAAALLKAGRNDDAEAAYRALLDANPRNSDDWEGLGDSYRARMMKVEAADCYKKALKYDATKTRLKDWLDANVRN